MNTITSITSKLSAPSPVIITLSLIGGDARNKLLLEYLKIVTEMRQFAIYVQ